jgi:hypothetical protein
MLLPPAAAHRYKYSVQRITWCSRCAHCVNLVHATCTVACLQPVDDAELVLYTTYSLLEFDYAITPSVLLRCVHRLTALRSIELKNVRNFAFASALAIVILLATPMIMVLIVLTVYFNTSGSKFNPSTVFTAVSLLLSIRYTLLMLPSTFGKYTTSHNNIIRYFMV